MDHHVNVSATFGHDRGQRLQQFHKEGFGRKRQEISNFDGGLWKIHWVVLIVCSIKGMLRIETIVVWCGFNKYNSNFDDSYKIGMDCLGWVSFVQFVAYVICMNEISLRVDLFDV